MDTHPLTPQERAGVGMSLLAPGQSSRSSCPPLRDSQALDAFTQWEPDLPRICLSSHQAEAQRLAKFRDIVTRHQSDALVTRLLLTVAHL
jgi:hypothetical protein